MSLAVGTLARLSPGMPTAGGGAQAAGMAAQYNAFDGGRCTVAGTVVVDGSPATPVRRRVRLYHRVSGRLVRETWSATDGTFSFPKVAVGLYLVLADDYTGVYEAEAADRVLATP